MAKIKVEAEAKKIGLRFNPGKCATLHLRGKGGKQRAVPTEFFMGDEPVKALQAGQAYQHLGIPTGYQVRQTPVATIEQLITDVRTVDDSLLTPWQKLDAVATFILPRLDFVMRGAQVRKAGLTAADKVIKRAGKRWLNLPQRASPEVVIIPPYRGGGGLLPLADLADVLTVAHAFRMLTCADGSVSALARKTLSDTVQRKLKRPPVQQDIAEYLSGSVEREFFGPSTDNSSFWSRVRVATRRQAAKLELKWRHDGGRDELSLECKSSRGRTVIIPPEARTQVINRLRTAIQEHYLATLLAKPDQGKVYKVSSGVRVANHFMRSGSYTRFAEWRFVHRARLDVLPLNGARRWGEGDKRCRRCNHALESLPHVLCHCTPLSAARQLRHDAIVARVAKAVKLPGTMTINQTVAGVSGGNLSALRPDIVIRNETTRSVTIVDITVPFENRRESFAEARDEKIRKYTPLAVALQSRGYNVEVEAILVGALGTWDPRNEPVLRRLRVNQRYASMMRRLIVSDTIHWSRDMYVEHVSGVRQYSAPPGERPG
ncbi:uncharacterized protein T26G10.4-like [Anastrepha obliqua]|uniref:uncharacterized protein T26G10.4-like n=1 Tax=Anastrepha obliqua TaxID=95512 RepID=UPI00240937C9|nr:uncharacterized protein T26G10.4-like [Anastrepha obliqua]